jgi:hypothetical protein
VIDPLLTPRNILLQISIYLSIIRLDLAHGTVGLFKHRNAVASFVQARKDRTVLLL